LFSNLAVGPVVSITRLDMRKTTVNDILDRGLFITAYITNQKHEAFKMFLESRPEEKPVAVFITMQYLENYD